MCIGYMQILSFYIRGLSILEFWYPRGGPGTDPLRIQRGTVFENIFKMS